MCKLSLRNTGNLDRSGTPNAAPNLRVPLKAEDSQGDRPTAAVLPQCCCRSAAAAVLLPQCCCRSAAARERRPQPVEI